MATLTYNPEEADAPEFNESEQEALAIGEQLQQQEQQLLAGKFKDAEELEKAYVELQGKLGQREEKTEQPKEEEPEPEKEAFLERLWNEAKTEYSKETLEELQGMKPEQIAQMYLEYRNQNQQPQGPKITEQDAQSLRTMVGGDEAYGNMVQWASQNFNEQEIDMYDQVMASGNPAAMFFAVQALRGRYTDGVGQDGQLLTGKRGSSTPKDVFRSQAEVIRAMSDPRYDKDPAYRQDIAQKLENSPVDF